MCARALVHTDHAHSLAHPHTLVAQVTFALGDATDGGVTLSSVLKRLEILEAENIKLHERVASLEADDGHVDEVNTAITNVADAVVRHARTHQDSNY